jgi:hypothetical protein
MDVGLLQSDQLRRVLYGLADNELEELLRSPRCRRRTSVIYGIFFRDHRTRTWSVIYIGQTRDLAKRWSEHQAKARAGGLTPLVAKMRKYPSVDFRIAALATAEACEVATELEDVLIDRHETLVPNGCNIMKGHGPQRSEVCRGYAKGIWADPDFRQMRKEFHGVRASITGWQRARTPRLTRLLTAAEAIVAKMPVGWQSKGARDLLNPLRRRLLDRARRMA